METNVAVEADVIVKTRKGSVRGSVAYGINTFKGIPYAAPPFGSRRFRAPRPVVPWSGVRDTLSYGPKPPQLPYPPPFEVLLPEPALAGEDCLTLNVWSSALGHARQPVMVFIPGGEFEHGTGAAFDGSRFARDGVVCVTINYRVGADGFLYLGPGDANRGLLDQVAALEWVQENIAAFGGDPDNVTVFGQSAGAVSIAMLLAMPRARGLFRRAICQSGAAHMVIPAAAAQRVTQRLAERLGVAARREALAAIPLERSLQAQAELRAELMANRDPRLWGQEVALSAMPWQPVLDGDIIPSPPIELIAGGASARIDLMVGSTLDEWRLFLVPNGVVDQITDEMLAGAVAAFGLPLEAALASYRAARPGASAGDLLAAILGDWYVRIPVMRLADAHAKNAKAAATHVYEFAWRSPQLDGRFGACHGLEVPFVFDTLGDGTEPLCGPNPPQQLADTMHAAWVAFATHGDCGWPQYEPVRRATMRFDTSSQVVDGPLSAERALWAGLR